MSTHSVSVVSNHAPTTQLTRGADALAQIKPRLEALPDEQLVTINTDLAQTATTILNHLPRIRSLAPEATTKLKDFDESKFTSLETLAMAAIAAHTLHMTAASVEENDLGELYQAALALRARLMGDVQYLVLRGLIDAQRLEGISCLNGHRNVSLDLKALGHLLRDEQEVVFSKCAVNAEDIAQASEMSERVLSAVTSREWQKREIDESARLRQRAYSLLFREYDAVRRIVSFLRWEQDDADQFAPSVFAGRRSGHSEKEAPSEAAAESKAPVAAGSGAAVTPGAPAVAPVASPVVSASSGLRGASPFIG